MKMSRGVRRKQPGTPYNHKETTNCGIKSGKRGPKDQSMVDNYPGRRVFGINFSDCMALPSDEALPKGF